VPRLELPPLSPGTVVLVVESHAGRTVQHIARVGKVGPVWVEIIADHRTWLMRLDDQTDGTPGRQDRFLTFEQLAWEQQLDDAADELLRAGVRVMRESPWGSDGDRLIALSRFVASLRRRTLREAAMSKRTRKYRQTPPKPKPSHIVTVLSGLAADGRTYVVTVQLDGDTARTLDRDQGHAWVSTVLAVAARAEHDSLVVRQFTEMGMSLHDAAHCVADLREDRPPLDTSATAPMRLEPGVNTSGAPFIGVFINGTQCGQWTCADARSHAIGILEVLTAVDLDAAYHRYLVGTIGVDADLARSTVHALADLASRGGGR
jgi:hypothetical protein